MSSDSPLKYSVCSVSKCVKLTLKETVESDNFFLFSVCIPAFTVMIFLTGNCSSCLISFNLSFASFKIAHKWIPWLQRAIFSEQSTEFLSGANYNGEFPEVHQSRVRHKLLRAPDLQHEVEYRRLPEWHFSKLTAICQSAMLNKSGRCVVILFMLMADKSLLRLSRPEWDWLNPNPGIYPGNLRLSGKK